jgi:hypothetical protein
LNTPCIHCGAETPIETICHRPAPERTFCPACRRTAHELLLARLDVFVEACRTRAAEKTAA